MFTLTIKPVSRDDQLHELQINGEFQRYIDAEHFNFVIDELIAAQLMSRRPQSSDQSDIELKVDHENEAMFKKRILAGKNKKLVELSSDLATTYYCKHPALFSYRDLSSYQNYWLKGEGNIERELLKTLSQDIHEKPYIDEPHDYIDLFSERAYHVNHGTVFALRLREYVKNYVTLVEQKGCEPWKAMAHQLTLEERACIQLAVFLLRSGRTNEGGWLDDATPPARSAMIFVQIATDLGFDHNLIQVVADNMFDFYKPLKIETCLSGCDENKTKAKVSFFRSLAHLAHDADMLRCNAKIDAADGLKEGMEKELGQFLESDHAAKANESFINYAANLCAMTGSPVLPEYLQASSCGHVQGNKKLAIQSVMNLDQTMTKLQNFRPDILVPPTLLSCEDFCHLTSSQLDVFTAQDVLDRVDIKSKEELERVIDKLNSCHRNWRRDENDRLLHLYTEKMQSRQIVPSLVSLCQSAVFYKTSPSDRQQHVKKRHHRLVSETIERARKLPITATQTKEALVLSDRQSPTEVWLNSDDHTFDYFGQRIPYIRNSNGEKISFTGQSWTPQHMEKIPTQACIEVEKEHLDTHIPVYHATTRQSYVLDAFCSALTSYGLLGSNSELGNIAWIRHFYAQPPRNAKVEHDMGKLRLTMTGENLDNMPVAQWHLLSCNPSLFQNSDYDSMESSVDYFLMNGSAIPPDFKGIFNEILDKTGLLIGETHLREKLFRHLMNAADSEVLGDQGVLYQYLIPWNVVNQVAYISAVNGKYYPEHTDALETLLKLQRPDQQPIDSEKLQVRLLVPALLDAQYAKDIKVKNYTNIPVEHWAAFHKVIRHCAYKAIMGPTKKYEATDEELPGEIKAGWHLVATRSSTLFATKQKSGEKEEQATDYSDFSKACFEFQLSEDDFLFGNDADYFGSGSEDEADENDVNEPTTPTNSM